MVSTEPIPVKQVLTFDDAAKLALDALDAAEAYINKLESEGIALEDRLTLEKERTKILTALNAAKDAQLAALEREKVAQLKIDEEKDNIIKVQAERIATLEKKKGGGFLKGFGIGFVAGFLGKALL